MGAASWVGRIIGCFKITNEHKTALEKMFNLPRRILDPNVGLNIFFSPGGGGE